MDRWQAVCWWMSGSVHGTLLRRAPPRDRPPAYAGRHIENIHTSLVQGGYRGSSLVLWRVMVAPTCRSHWRMSAPDFLTDPPQGRHAREGRDGMRHHGDGKASVGADLGVDRLYMRLDRLDADIEDRRDILV